MAIATYNWTWQEGEDLIMSLVYKEGPVGSEVPVNLTGYSLRMDLATSTTPITRVYTLNSANITEISDTTLEVTLGTAGEITITVPRALTLTTGEVAALFTGTDPLVLNYDIFLRNASNKQSKILRGSITVERSFTKWL